MSAIPAESQASAQYFDTVELDIPSSLHADLFEAVGLVDKKSAKRSVALLLRFFASCFCESLRFSRAVLTTGVKSPSSSSRYQSPQRWSCRLRPFLFAAGAYSQPRWCSSSSRDLSAPSSLYPCMAAFTSALPSGLPSFETSRAHSVARRSSMSRRTSLFGTQQFQASPASPNRAQYRVPVGVSVSMRCSV